MITKECKKQRIATWSFSKNSDVRYRTENTLGKVVQKLEHSLLNAVLPTTYSSYIMFVVMTECPCIIALNIICYGSAYFL